MFDINSHYTELFLLEGTAVFPKLYMNITSEMQLAQSILQNNKVDRNQLLHLIQAPTVLNFGIASLKQIKNKCLFF